MSLTPQILFSLRKNLCFANKTDILGWIHIGSASWKITKNHTLNADILVRFKNPKRWLGYGMSKQELESSVVSVYNSNRTCDDVLITLNPDNLESLDIAYLQTLYRSCRYVQVELSPPIDPLCCNGWFRKEWTKSTFDRLYVNDHQILAKYDDLAHKNQWPPLVAKQFINKIVDQLEEFLDNPKSILS
jgi:hypothetical protein